MSMYCIYVHKAKYQQKGSLFIPVTNNDRFQDDFSRALIEAGMDADKIQQRPVNREGHNQGTEYYQKYVSGFITVFPISSL